MSPRRTIVGVQVHHSVNLDDASRFGVNMLTALSGALAKTGTESEHGREIKQALDQLGPAVRVIGNMRSAAGLRLQLHHADPDFKRYVEGELPFPDETTDGFVPRCSCGDRCLHEQGLNPGPAGRCICDSDCPQHPPAEAA